MSEENSSPACGLTRRSFLKTTAAVAAGATATMSLASCASKPESVDVSREFVAGQPENEGEQIFRGVCRPNCFGFCHLNVHVRDGKVVKTSRAPYNEACYSRICQRGLSHVHRIYDPARLQYPMRRVDGTERGAGEWERVSWDEALTEIADKVKEIQGKYGNGAVAFLTQSGNQSGGCTSAYTRLINLMNASNISPCLDMGSFYGMMAVAGMVINPMMGLNMWNGNEPTDAKNAKTIMVWGANITDAQVQNWHLVKEAMQGGTKLVVIDPIFTQVASKADLWVPIRPGADTALKYGIMYCELEKKAQDVDFLMNHTVAPFLVRSDTGMFLRRSDTGVAPVATGVVNPQTGQEVMDDPFMVLDANGDLIECRPGVPCSIEGSYEHDGVDCRTAYSLLKEEILKFNPQRVSELTEIPVETIYQLADICIDGPVYHYEGYGPQAYNNGGHTTMAGLTMCALTGNLGKHGASYGAFWGIHVGSNAAYTSPTGAASTGATIPTVDLKRVVESGKFCGKDCPIKMLYMYSANPLNTHTDTHAWTDVIIPGMDYVVVADSVLTDSALYADMVLPIAQWFELEEVGNAGQTYSLNYSEKAIDPLYESKPDTQIVSELAAKLGLGEFFTLTNEQILDEVYSGPLNEMMGTDMASLRKRKQARFLPGDAEKAPYVAYENGVFGTATGRFEFYREFPTPRALCDKVPTPEEINRERMAHWFPPLEAWPENPLYKKYPLVLMSERPRYRVHSQWFSVPLLRELDPEPFVKMNPEDAAARGIENGMYVECYNDRGTAVAKVVVSEAIRKGTLVYPKGWQRYQHKSGGWSELSSTEYDPFGINNNFMDVLCEIRVWEGEDK